MAFGDGRRVERRREADEDRVVRLVQLARVAGLGREDLGAGDEALRPEEPDGELVLVAGRSHRDRDRDRFLAGPGGPDLQGRFADDPVVAELEGGAADGHDLGARDVADRLEAVVLHARHVVMPSIVQAQVRSPGIRGDHGVTEATIRPVASSPERDAAVASPGHQA